MGKRRVYVDSCVLITAFKATEGEGGSAALEALDDDGTEYLYSRITELEVLPKAVFNKRGPEQEFYRAFFAAAERVPCTEATINAALTVGQRNGLGACDALHVTCAVAANADELITSEKKTRLPSAPEPGIRIRTLRRG